MELRTPRSFLGLAKYRLVKLVGDPQPGLVPELEKQVRRYSHPGTRGMYIHVKYTSCALLSSHESKTCIFTSVVHARDSPHVTPYITPFYIQIPTITIMRPSASEFNQPLGRPCADPRGSLYACTCCGMQAIWRQVISIQKIPRLVGEIPAVVLCTPVLGWTSRAQHKHARGGFTREGPVDDDCHQQSQQITGMYL